MKKFLAYTQILAIVMLTMSGAFRSIPTAQAVGYTPGDVLINEFRIDGTQWVEFQNTTSNNIDLSASTWELVATVMGPGSGTTTLSSGIIPAYGLLTFEISGLPSAAPTLLSLNNNASVIYSVSYGTPAFGAEPHLVGYPGAGESVALTGGTTWSTTTDITRGWYNEGPAPTIASIVSDINSGGVVTNMDSLPDHTAAEGLYFEKRTTLGDPATALGKLEFAGPLNLTNASTTAILQDLGNKMDAAAGSMSFDARTATDLQDAGATIYMYQINDIGYDVSNLSLSDMTVKDDEGNILMEESLPGFTNFATSSDNNGTFSFTTSHFTQFGFDPILEEVTPVSDPTTSANPLYTFSSNVSGTAIFGGDCAMAASTTIIGNNTIRFGPLAAGTYSNCTIQVIDGAGASSTLGVSIFTVVVDLDLPLVESSYLNVPGSYLSRSLIGSSTFAYVVTFNEDMDTEVDPTITFDPTLADILVNRHYSWTGIREVQLIADVVDQALEGQSVNSTIADAKDLAANTMDTVNPLDQFTVDLIAPATPNIDTINSSTSTAQTSTVSAPEITLSGLTVDNYYYIYDYFDESTTTIVSRLATSDTETNYLDLGEGTHLITAQSSDYANNYSGYSAAMTYALDTIPSLSSTGASEVGTSTATLDFTTDEAGTYYYLVWLAPNGNILGGSPGAAKVKAQGTAVAKGTSSISVGSAAVSVAGLSAGTGYNAFVIVEDSAGNLSAVSKIPFNTIAPNVYVDDDYNSSSFGGHNWGVDAFSTIQEGINAISENGTVYVAAGNYSENITIDKSISLIGSIGSDLPGPGDDAPTIYDSSGSNRTINIMASGVTVRGFIIQNNAYSYPAIRIGTDISSTTISNNDLSNAYTGITLSPGSNNNSIARNRISSAYHGIFMNGSINNAISDNEISYNSGNGIEIIGNKVAGGNVFNGNNIHNNSGNGINLGSYLDTSDGAISIDSNTIDSNSGAGVYVNSGTSDIGIENNTIANNGHLTISTGIHVLSATGNWAHNNIISNDDGDTGVNNEDTDNIFDASENYWGSADGPYSEISNTTGNASSSVIGLIKYRPYFTDEARTVTSTVTVDPGDLGDLFGNGGSFSVPDGETSTAATQINVDEETTIGVTAGAGTSTVVLPEGTVITKTAGGAFDGSLITATDVSESNLSGLASGWAAEGAFQWGVPSLGLTFSPAITINIFVGTAYNGQTLTIYRSQSTASGWETSGIVAPGTCVVASGICTFQTTKASYFAAAKYTSTGGSGGGSGGISVTYPELPANWLTVSPGLSVNTRNVTFNYNVSNAAYILASEDSTFTGNSWDNYASSKAFTLSEGNGTKTVYFKFRSSAGGDSSLKSVTISLSGMAGAETSNVTPPAAASYPTIVTPTILQISNTSSPIVFSNVSASSIQPGTRLLYDYSYKNNTAKTAKVKITRQLFNNKNKVIATVSAIAYIKSGATLSRSVNQMMSKYLTPGLYDVKVKISDLTNKQNYENSFKLNVEKLKAKYFELGGAAATGSALSFDPASISRIKTDRKLPVNVSFRYGYENKTEAKQTLRIIKELVAPDGRVLSSRSAKWLMLPAEKYFVNSSQYLGTTLGAGNYSVRLRAQDWTTKAPVAENALNFSIILK